MILEQGQQLELILPELPSLIARVDLALSKPYSPDCHIEAANDIEAVLCWLKKYIHNTNTFSSYRRQVRLFLMWCCFEKGKTLGQLKAQDIEEYFSFLKAPPENWCTNRTNHRKGVRSSNWRPLVSTLSEPAIRMTYRVLNSLFNYLFQSQYISGNVLKLMNTKTFKHSFDEQKYQVWTRMLEEDEWAVVQKTLEELPENTSIQLANKLRTQFLFALLYFLGLRIHEVASHTWRSFQFREGNWWFFVKGKGGKLGHIPVHDKLLSFVKLYRISLKLSPLPNPDEDTPLILSLDGKPIGIRQIFNMVKKSAYLASLHFKDEPRKSLKLKKLSPHWLRHLSASHQDKAGISDTMIKENLRHGSLQTTQIYLHTADMLRHEAMQKLSLNVTHKQLKKMLISQTLVIIKLTKGPVHKGLGFKKLTEALEEAFNEHKYRYQAYQFEKEQKVKEIEQSIIPVTTISFSYLFTNFDEIQNDNLRKVINLETGARLFHASIDVRRL